MPARITIALIVLLILFSVAGATYVIDSQKEISTLKQRVVELKRQLLQAQTQHSRLQANQPTKKSNNSVSNTPLKPTMTVTAPEADSSLSDEGNLLRQAIISGDVEALR